MPIANSLQALLVVLFLSFLVIKIIAHKRRGLRPVVLRHPGESVLLCCVFGWFFAVLIFSLGHLPQLARPLLFKSPLLNVAGMGMSLLGLALFLAALIQMGHSWHIGIDEDVADELVTHGVFSWSRHPIYVFIILFGWGTFLINGSVFFGVSAILISLGVHRRMLEEERFLLQAHGEKYEAYQRRVLRYFGRSSRRDSR